MIVAFFRLLIFSGHVIVSLDESNLPHQINDVNDGRKNIRIKRPSVQKLESGSFARVASSCLGTKGRFFTSLSSKRTQHCRREWLPER
jgi:hypothetical protein